MTRCRSLWLWLLVCYLPSAFATQELIGAAEYTRYKRSYYVGGLYAQAGADKEAVFKGQQPAAMMILVTAKRLTQRDFRNSWLQAVAVNNDQQTLEANTRDVLRFSNVPKASLVTGDVLKITTDGAKQVVVSINGIDVETFSSSTLFAFLLNTWIGSVPPSTPFKNGIRGIDVNQALVDQLNSHQVAEERIATIRSWGAEEVAAAAKPAAPAKEPTKVAPAPVKTSSPKPVVTTKPLAPAAKPAIEAKPQPQTVATLPEKKPKVSKPEDSAVSAMTKSEPPKAAPVVTAEAVKETVAETNPKPEPKLAKAASKVTPEPVPEPPPAMAQADSEPVEQAAVEGGESLEDEPELTEDQMVKQLLVRQTYLATLRSEINIHKHVPQQAIMRRVSGEVRVSIEIDRRGKIQSMDFVEASKHGFFNKQAKQAINKAAPFDPVPDALTGETFTFEVLLYYPPYF